MLIVDDNDQRAWSHPVKEHVLGDGALLLHSYSFDRFSVTVKEHVLGDGALLLSSIDLQRRRLRLLAFQPTAP